MQVIRTVCGDIDARHLGVCHIHEHILCDQRKAHFSSLIDVTGRRAESSYMILDDMTIAERELHLFKARGGNSMVEVTTSGWGRDLEALAQLSRRTGVHIVATAGYYTEPHLPQEIREKSIDELSANLISEITTGQGPNNIKPGILKSAIYHSRIEGLELKGLRAVARAQKATGLAITTHTTGARRYEIPFGNIGQQALVILLEEGVQPQRLLVGHSDVAGDLSFMTWACNQGAYVQIDLISKQHWLLDETRVDLIVRMLELGFDEQILLGTDRCRKHELYPELGGTGYTYILDRFLPLCESRGIPAELMKKLLVDNPARALAIPAVPAS